MPSPGEPLQTEANPSGRRYKAAVLAAACACALGAALPALGGDVHDLEQNVPLEIEDVFPTPAGERQLQLTARYERMHGPRNQGDFEARVQYGLAQDWQVALGVPVRAGDTRGSGDVTLQVFRKLSDEQGLWPAFAAGAQVELPSGKDSRGVDTTLKVIATHALRPGDPASPRAHANLAWTYNAAPLDDERRDGYKAIVGYSHPLDDKTVVLADFVHEQAIEKGQRSNVLEVGWLREVRESTTVAVGVGAGFGQESPRVRVTLALQQSF